MAYKWDNDAKRGPLGTSRANIPAELHFQTCKKIAQLTKVIYTLNVRLDEQECALEAQRDAHEERIQQILNDTRAKISHYKAKASGVSELQQRLTSLEAELNEEKRIRSAAEVEAKRLKLSVPSSSLEEAQCWQRLVSKLKAHGGGGDPLNADLDVIWTLLRGAKGGRGKVVADIPEKDVDVPPPEPSARPTSSLSEEQDHGSQEQWRCPSCGGHKQEDQEEELLERLAENERMTERLQQEIGNLERSLASKDQEVSKLQKKVCTQRTTTWTQTDVTEEPVQAEKDSPVGRDEDVSPGLQDDLRRTLAGFQNVAQDLRETKVGFERHQRELRDLIEGDDFKKPSAHSQESSRIDKTTASTEGASGQSEGQSTSEKGSDPPPTARETKEAQTEFKTKVAQLLQQMTLLMTAPELSSCNMSDAEKECMELRRRLREAHEQHKTEMQQKESEFQDTLRETLKQKEEQMMRQEQEQHTEFEKTLKHLEEKWQQERSTDEQDHALIAKLELELSDCKRLLQSQTELQTAEMSRMSRDLEAALKSLNIKEAELSTRECCLMKELEEERCRSRALLQQSQQHQRQAEALSRQLDLKRDELIQLRKEAMQQIRNLENYWLEKVNKELEKVKKGHSEDKKVMLENFCKAQRLLKDKILVLQQAKSPPMQTSSVPPGSNPPTRSDSAPQISKRRGSVMSQIEYCIHEEDGEDEDEPDVQERICSSQPNVAKLTEPTLNLKKERFMQNQRFIKRAESVLLPKLQFLSFFKSASHIDKDSQNHSKQLPQNKPRCNSSSDGVPLYSPPLPEPSRHSSSNGRKRPKKSSSGLRASDTLKCPLLFQESRSSSCCNLTSCQQSRLDARELSPKRTIPKTRDYYNKRHSVGAKFWIGPLTEAAGGECEDTDSESTDSDLEVGKKNKQEHKQEPLLESEL